MTPDRPQKIKLLRLLDLLQRETDVDHPISRQDLCQRLNDMGISSNLRTLSLDIETLKDAGYVYPGITPIKKGLHSVLFQFVCYNKYQ